MTSAVTAASIPSGCTITATAFRNNKQTAVRHYTFKPATGLLGVPVLSDQMTKAVLGPAFLNVDKVTFSATGLIKSTLQAVLIDNVQYDAFIKSGTNFIPE